MRRRLNIRASRPLIFPAILLASLAVLTEVLSSLSFVDQALIGVVKMLPPWFLGVSNVLDVIGNFPALIVVALVMASFEFWQRRRVRGWVMLASLSCLPIFFLIKELVRRARPVNEYVSSHGLHGFSFPSGHATGSAVVYGMVALLIWSNNRQAWARVASWSLLGLIVLVGVSRVYLGAHFPTDVLGGWLLALLIVSILRSITLAAAKHSEGTRAEVMRDTTEGEAVEGSLPL